MNVPTNDASMPIGRWMRVRCTCSECVKKLRNCTHLRKHRTHSLPSGVAALESFPPPPTHGLAAETRPHFRSRQFASMTHRAMEGSAMRPRDVVGLHVVTAALATLMFEQAHAVRY